MKNTAMFLAVLGALCGAQTALATPLQEKPCINLGVAPYGNASPIEAMRLLGLDDKQIKQALNQTPRRVWIKGDWLLAKMVFAGGKVLENVRVCGKEKAELRFIDAGNGKKIVLIKPDKCTNWSILAEGQELLFPPKPTPVLTPPVTQVVPPAPLPIVPPAAPAAPPVVVTQAPPGVPSKQVEKKPAGIEYDVYGQYKWTSSSSSRNESGYVEGMVWNGDIGVGALASESRGHSTSTKSAWDIDLIGVQLGFKGGETFVTEDGKTEKRLWQIKPRLALEHEQTVGSKGKPDRNQRTILAGAYVENLKTDGQCLYGWVGGFWIPLSTSVNAGKEAEDRTSVYAHARRECKIDEKWSWRVDGGPGWSAVSGTVLDIAGQLRYKTESGVTFFIGPQLGWSFEKGAFFWAGFIGAQFGGTDSGILHNKYVEDHKVEPTGRSGAEVFAPVAAAQVPTVRTAAVAVTAAPVVQTVTSPQSDEEVRRALEVWWAGLSKK